MSGGGKRTRRLITERDVARLAAGAKILLDRDTIVTPAARDLAFARGIEVVEAAAPRAISPLASAPPAAASAATPDVPAGGWPKLADGDYLLEVRDGRVRARRVGN